MIKEMDKWPIGKVKIKIHHRIIHKYHLRAVLLVAALVRVCVGGESWLLHCWYKHKMERESIKHCVAVIALEP